MEIQERSDSEENPDEGLVPDSTEKRLYNGFQGPLTETEESSLQPSIGSGNFVTSANMFLLAGWFVLVLPLLT